MFKIEKTWIAPEWERSLKDADLLDIESVSKRDFNWFEEPNRRRGGWSGVTRIVLNPNASVQDQRAVFLKIQQNHFYRAPNTLFRKQLTFEREFEVLRQLDSVTDSIPDLVLFSKWRSGSDVGSILITKALDDWFPLTDWLNGRKGYIAPDEVTFQKALEAIAKGAREIHQAGWVHLCFSAKHLFVRPTDDGDFESCVIDMEKCRKHLSASHRTRKDCAHFMRHTPGLTEAHKLAFTKAYFQTDTFSNAQKRIIHKMRGGPAI